MLRVKVYLSPTGTYSRAMVRVANALEHYKPSWVEIVKSPRRADLLILHVISQDAIGFTNSILNSGKRCAIIQYCLKTAGGDISLWQNLWQSVDLVWSYYTLDLDIDTFYYYAPLGLDNEFGRHPGQRHRERAIITTGYVSGPGAEAIEEVWQAARHCDITTYHIGPRNVTGIKNQSLASGVRFCHNIPDSSLATLYSRVQWVSGLRYIEGFELPALEGLACGARPLLFDQSDLRQWYVNHAIYLPELCGDSLVESLIGVMSKDPTPVTDIERREILNTFDWSKICKSFWRHLLSSIEDNRNVSISYSGDSAEALAL